MLAVKKKETIEITTVEELESIAKDSIKNFKCFTEDIKIKITEYLSCTNKQYFSKIPNDIKKLIGGGSSLRVKSYWTCRGYTETEAIENVSNIQKRNSPRCVEYWLEKGYSKEEAITEVSEIQKNNASKLYEKYSKEDWKKFSNRCVEYWLEKGYSKEEAEKIISNNSKYYTSLEQQIKLHGKDEGEKKWQEIQKKKVHYGENNPQYGKPAPKGSGHGISGFYKNYYFRSLLEYYYIKQLEREGVEFYCNDVKSEQEDNKIVVKMDNGKNYIPDFRLEKKVIEVKSEYNKKTALTLYKEQQFRKQYPDLEYEILTEKNINTNKQILLEDYRKGLIKIDKGKQTRFFKNHKELK